MRRIAPIAATLLVLGGLVAAGCGESAEEKAQSEVCDARADIQTQVQKLGQLTLTTASINAIQQSLGAIGDDLQTIKDAQGDLSGSRKQEVQAAVTTFGSAVSAIAGDAVSGLASGQAEAKLESALQQLGTSFRTAFAPVDCS